MLRKKVQMSVTSRPWKLSKQQTKKKCCASHCSPLTMSASSITTSALDEAKRLVVDDPPCRQPLCS